METVGLGFSFEDLPVGREFRTIGRTVTEADIINFVNCTGMVEVLFTNLEFLAHESDIKQRLVPAALVYALAEGLLVQSTMQHTGLAFLHMELNVENRSSPAIRSMPNARSSKPGAAAAGSTAAWCAPASASSNRTVRSR